MTENTLLSLAGIIILGIAAQWLVWRFHLPSILLMLLLGFLVGPVSGLLDPDAVLGPVLFPFVSLSVAIILFEGGLSLKLCELGAIRNVVMNLVTIGALVIWGLTTWAAYVFLDLTLPLALLFGAILVVSRPNERLFLSWMAPRGIVAAAVSSIFALELLHIGYAGAEHLAPLVFLVIIGTVTVYGLTAMPVGRWLKVTQPDPQGVLIAGAHNWAREFEIRRTNKSGRSALTKS